MGNPWTSPLPQYGAYADFGAFSGILTAQQQASYNERFKQSCEPLLKSCREHPTLPHASPTCLVLGSVLGFRVQVLGFEGLGFRVLQFTFESLLKSCCECPPPVSHSLAPLAP